MNKTLDYATTALAAVLLLALAVLSVRGILDPAAAAQAFGLAVGDSSAAFYHAVYRDRNLVLAATGLIFLFTGMRRALAVLATTAVSLPAYDLYALKAVQVPAPGIHVVTLVALLVLSAMLWIREAQAKAR